MTEVRQIRQAIERAVAGAPGRLATFFSPDAPACDPMVQNGSGVVDLERRVALLSDRAVTAALAAEWRAAGGADLADRVASLTKLVYYEGGSSCTEDVRTGRWNALGGRINGPPRVLSPLGTFAALRAVEEAEQIRPRHTGEQVAFRFEIDLRKTPQVSAGAMILPFISRRYRRWRIVTLAEVGIDDGGRLVRTSVLSAPPVAVGREAAEQVHWRTTLLSHFGERHAVPRPVAGGEVLPARAFLQQLYGSGLER